MRMHKYRTKISFLIPSLVVYSILIMLVKQVRLIAFPYLSGKMIALKIIAFVSKIGVIILGVIGEYRI